MRFQVISVLVSLLAGSALPGQAETLRHFGYAAVACGHDDPHDATAKSDYIDEVAGFSNIAQVCPDGDPAVTADRLRRADAAGLAPLLLVEPAFFARKGASLAALPPDESAAIWAILSEGITRSGVDPSRIIFYVVDEPAHFGLPPADVDAAARAVRADYPSSPLLVIEAWNEAGPPPVSPEIDYWGFDVYGVPDPAAEPRYGAFLDAAKATMRPGQKLVLVMEAMHHTAIHPDTTEGRESLAGIARAYHAYAVARGDVAMILAYAWAGGIDGPAERGIRDLPQKVQDAHRSIGKAILAAQP